MAAGDKVKWSHVATRVGSVAQTSDSGTFTTSEAVRMTMSPFLTSGLLYGVTVYVRLASSVAADVVICRVREDSATGTELSQAQFYIPTNSGSGFGFYLYAEYTAVATAAKTLVFTANRAAGSGNITLKGAAVAPSRMHAALVLT